MKYNFLSFLFFLAYSLSLCPQIYEIKSVEGMEPYISQVDDVLIVFDIDSTLLKIDNSGASTPWFCNELELLQKNQNQPRELLYKKLLSQHAEKLYKEYSQTLMNVHIELAEKSMKDIIGRLITHNVHFLIETKRGLPHIDITQLQLNSVGITYKSNKKWANICYKLTEGLRAPAYYDDGILFTGFENTKGEALKALLKRLSYKPKRLVALDDQRDNLVSFEIMAHEMGIEFIGLRYGFLDAFTKRADPNLFDPLNCGVIIA